MECSLSLLQGIFSTQGLNPGLPGRETLQADSLPAEPQGKPPVWITTNQKILKEMGTPDHLMGLLRNLYVGQ